MLRGIWQDGWKAVAIHAPFGKGNFEADRWELYHVAVDCSESTDLAAQHPDKLDELKKAWVEEAEKNLVLPLDYRTPREILNQPRPSEEAVRERYAYYPGTAPVPEGVAVNVRGRSYKILANVDLTNQASGVVFAHGSRFGGHALFIKDHKLHYVYNFLGIGPEQVLVSKRLEPGKQTLGVEFVRDSAGPHGESIGKAKLYVNEQLVAEGPWRTQAGKFTLSGDGLCVGYDSGDAVSHAYPGKPTFVGGQIFVVGVTVEGAPYVDLEREAARLMLQQ